MNSTRWLHDKINSLLAAFEITVQDLHQIYSSSEHSPYVSSHRASIINERIKVISLFFSLMILLWIPIDFTVLPNTIAAKFAILRISSSGLFLALAGTISSSNDRSYAYSRLLVMMLIPSLFYMVATQLTHGINVSETGKVLVGIYDFLPFIIVAGLSLFPLTLIEVVVAGAITCLIIAISVIYSHDTMSPAYYSAAWILILIMGADALSSSIQLKYMSSLLHRISSDKLTGALSRHAGEEILDLHFELAVEKEKPFAIAFVDLDYFKKINDEYGHDAGDAALVEAVRALNDVLRRSDQVIRWGGEEFVVMLPDANAAGVKLILERIKEKWLGKRPDNTTLTASIGMAERVSDSAGSWGELVEIADKRMYKAKNSGRAQIVFN